MAEGTEPVQGTIKEPARGVFLGTLLEDMIVTVNRTHQMYCDVDIPSFYSKDANHPLTRVPLWGMSLPLKKGDKVMVEFWRDDLTMPVLFKNPTEVDDEGNVKGIPPGIYEKFEIPEFIKGNVENLKSQDTVSAQWIGENSYIVKTESYTIIHQNNGFVLIDSTDNVYVYGSSVNIVSSGDVNIDCGGKFAVTNSSKGQSLFQILNNVLTILNSTLRTQGSPANHVVEPNQFTTDIQNLTALMKE